MTRVLRKSNKVYTEAQSP